MNDPLFQEDQKKQSSFKKGTEIKNEITADLVRRWRRRDLKSKQVSIKGKVRNGIKLVFYTIFEFSRVFK